LKAYKFKCFLRTAAEEEAHSHLMAHALATFRIKRVYVKTVGPFVVTSDQPNIE